MSDKTVSTNAWGDREDKWTKRINAAHPIVSGSHGAWQLATDMVGNRHSKRALVELVNWLLTEVPNGRI